MQLKTDGLILAEKSISDNDRLVTILTRQHGVIRAFARGTKNSKNKNFAGSQLLCYSELVIYRGRDKYIINEATLKNSFWKIRNGIEKLALAQYFCELITIFVDENIESQNILRLILNSIYYLEKNLANNRIIKSVFEMRLLAMLGYMPDLLGCACCNDFKPNKLFFSFSNNQLLCDKCLPPYVNALELSSGLLAALRYCIYADFSKMFSFSINDTNLSKLNKITESYLLSYTDKPLYSLDFYKRLVENYHKY